MLELFVFTGVAMVVKVSKQFDIVERSFANELV